MVGWGFAIFAECWLEISPACWVQMDIKPIQTICLSCLLPPWLPGKGRLSSPRPADGAREPTRMPGAAVRSKETPCSITQEKKTLQDLWFSEQQNGGVTLIALPGWIWERTKHCSGSPKPTPTSRQEPGVCWLCQERSPGWTLLQPDVLQAPLIW